MSARSLLALATLSQALCGAEMTWSGTADSNFENPANWSPALPADSTATDTARFTGTPGSLLPALSLSRSLAGLILSTPTGGWTLAGAPEWMLTLGASGLNASAQTSGVNLIEANLALAATQTWQIGAGGTLRLTGSLRAGESTTNALAGQLIIGGSTSGDLTLDPGAGRSVSLYTTLTSAGALQVNRRLLLGSGPGSTASPNILHNATSAGIRISNTGVLEVRSGEWRTNDLGSNNTSAFTGRLVLSGGTLATGGARYMGQFNGAIGTEVTLSGGTLLVTGGGSSLSNSGHLGLGAHGSATPTGTILFNVTGGLLDVARGAGIQPSGVTSAAMLLGGIANTTVLVNQSGGTVRVGLTPGSHVLTGLANANANTNLSIGSSLAANQTAYTLAGGELIVAGAVQGVVSAGGVSNFNFIGGRLSAGAVNATALGHSPMATVSSGQTAASVEVGTLVNLGGRLEPGAEGIAGRTLVTGAYRVASPTAALSLDIGGTAQATAFQTGGHDFVSVTGPVTLDGLLAFRVLPGFTPSAGDTFTVLSAGGGLSGTFSNAPFGARVVSEDGLHTFVVTRSGDSIVLGDYAPVGPPVISSTSIPAAIASGDSFLIGVGVSSFAPVTYEWRRNGVPIPDASLRTLGFFDFTPDAGGLYEVTVRNAAGSATQAFTVHLTVPQSAENALVDAGTTRVFSASAGAVSARWILNGETVSETSAYSFTPGRREVGTHWLRLVETLPNGATLTRHWTVRVRIPFPASALAYHVSPSGNDANAGTLAAPFRTLERARDVIRTLTSGQRAGGVTVFLRDGVHRRTTTFTLSAQDSGTPSAPIVYAAYPGETPILTSTRVLAAADWAPLASSETARVAPGADPARIWEVSVAGNTRAVAPPAVFNEWLIFNALRSSQNGGLLEVFQNGQRLRISRYPNVNLANDALTPNLAMDGVATGAAIDGTGYLNGAGDFTPSTGAAVRVGGAFHYSVADAARVERWQAAISRGGLWLAGYWRVPWQLNGIRIQLIDTGKRVIGLVPNPSNSTVALVSNGIGDKYTRPAGSRKEPWWALNLLEEMDQPGEWAIDFSRQRLYLLMDRAGSPADGEIELSDVGTPMIQLNAASDIRIQGLTFRRHLGINVQVINGGSRNLVVGCRFVQSGNMAVDINAGTENGVLSSDFDNLGSGGVMLRGGSMDGETPVPANHFAVNNRFRSFGEVVRVYQAAIDVGYGGPMGNWGLPTVGMRVAHNDVRTSPHAGILWNGHRHLIEYNEVSDFTRISNDLGAIYRYGRNADFRTVIRYNHLFDSPLGEGVYNDMDHVRTPVYGNTINLKTPATAQRGYGFWSNTHTTTGEANTTLPMGLQVYNNIAVNTRSGFQFHSATGGRIENNVSYRPLGDHFRWFRITTNTTTNTHVVNSSNAATLQSGPNLGYAADPGFISYASDDLRLRPDSQIYRDLPGFDPMPLEMAGLDNDETRTSGARVWTPFIVTGSAEEVGANTATFTGTLVYPQFERNATVRVYWGTEDGGTDPLAWQNSAVLGTPGAGRLSHTPVSLAPATVHYFRFHAVNSAGEHWSERTNLTTTFPLGSASIGGVPSASSGASTAAFAFDGSTATDWTVTDSGAGTLAYTVAGEGARVTRYSVTSSASAQVLDPASWTLQGSLDGAAWRTLDSRSGIVFTSRIQTLHFGFTNTLPYRHYRLVVTASSGAGTALSIAELGLGAPDATPDTTGPVITTPGNLTVTGTTSGAIVTFEVSAFDAVSGVTQATAVPASGSLFPPGNTLVTVSAIDAFGNASTATFTITVLPPTLPAPWRIQQIKPYTGVAPGTVEVLTPTSFRIAGAGGASTGGTTGDLWTGTNDSNTYVSVPWEGDGTFTARLASFTSTDSAAKAGIIFRETTESGSRYSVIYMIRNNSGAVYFQHKTATGGSSSGTNFFNGNVSNRGIPEWLRLIRRGDSFSMAYSADGISWLDLGTPRINVMGGASLSVGFVVAPRTGGAAATAVFDNISFLTPRQAWNQTHFGSADPIGVGAPDADPDGDQIANLMEYALGRLPNSPDVAGAPMVGLVQIEPAPAPHLALTFRRIADPLLLYQVEATDELTTGWVPIWSSTGAANIAGEVTITDAVELNADRPRRMLRLRVESR